MVNNEILNPPKQSLQQAQHFLTLLDESAEKFTFQYFADNNKDENLDSGHFYDSIENSFSRLVALNNKGYGVFVTVNETDGKGRLLENITSIRSVFQEIDHGIKKENPIEPTFIVESSPNKYHNYFLCDGLSKDQFSGVMRRMIDEYGSDKNAKDLTRVLRLPGFFHQKDPQNPHLVNITHESGLQNYDSNTILKNFPVLEEEKKVILKSTPTSIIVDDQSEQVCINRIIDTMQKSGAGERHGNRLGAAKLAGGFVAGGFISEQKAIDVLMQISDSISDSGVTNKTECKTIMDGLEYGKAEPIRDVFFKRELSEVVSKNKKVSTESFLDTVTHSHTIDFLESIDKRHILSQLSKNVAHVCYLPEHSVFMTALGVFSAMACRRYKVKYKHNGDLPISLYVMAEQPSGAAKSRSLNLFQHPFRKARKISDKARKERISELKKDDSGDSDYKAELNDLQENAPPPLFITNATPEALEQTLTPTGGYFAAVSSEKGLANAILGASYGDSSRANNNDVLLNGFDGGYVASIRVTRSGYEGNVVGSVVVIAQQGSIERLLGESDGSGLSERFLLLSEEHYLGKRDFTEERFFYHELVDEYNAICEELYDLVNDEKTDYEDLIELDICKEGHVLIAEYRNNIEKDLADGGRLSSTSIRGAAAKVDMQIMKIAANLHLLGGGISSQYNTIDIHYIKDAITIANNMLDANLSLCTDKGITGLKSEYESILSLFEKNNMPRTERMILQCKRRTAPFKDMSFEVGMTKTKYIKNLLQSMLKDGTLICSIDGAGNTVFKSS